ncbi:MAG: hypothetical protein HY791_37910 [Deltaproteobacteria bacterium]|nr:hypothetical protein [Deltaproteobacteria bacterium]
MSTISIRIDPQTSREIDALRAGGVVVSELVRAAIHDAYVRAQSGRESRLAVLERIDRQLASPMTEGSPRPEHDVTDARQAREVIRKRLRRARSGR